MKFKVGDQVRIKPFFLIKAETEEYSIYRKFSSSEVYFNREMRKLCGKPFTITSIEERFRLETLHRREYILSGLDTPYVIADWMVMPADEPFDETSIKSELLKLNSRVDELEERLKGLTPDIEFIDHLERADRVKIEWYDGEIGEFICAIVNGEYILVHLENGALFSPPRDLASLKYEIQRAIENETIRDIDLIK